IFVSDNGYHMGEKEFLFKNSLWERSARVPLLVAGPGLARGEECDQPVSLLDLYPTINEFLGLPQDSGPLPLDGYSFAALARDPESDWGGPPMAVTAIGCKGPCSAADPGKVEDQHFSIRSRTHRYLRYASGEEELYDHINDPYEWHNLKDDPAAADVKAALRQELDAQVF
ncbi:MAG: sulfatase-like hydrolase/transferase, partial [Verrucomicrobia bacterium]|nr:sulfatase-like hydrolase/transferase [Verrucomicrobiota bacterium]